MRHAAGRASIDGKRKAALFCLALLLVACALVSIRLWKSDATGTDVYYDWIDGRRILSGENPYARVLAGNMRDNDKYTTYFPVFIILSWLTQLAGLREFPQWVAFWRVVFLICNLGIASAIFYLLYRRQQYGAALFGALFWIFNRWVLYTVTIAHLDFIAILLLIASLGLFKKHRWSALLLLSLSLGVKQIAIFLVPLYLIWIWQTTERNRPKEVLLAAVVMASVPVATSLPFVVWNAEGYAKSIIFSMTRVFDASYAEPSLDVLLGWTGFPARLPMLGLMVLVYWIAWRRKVGMYTSVLFVMATFIAFSTVLFRQYLSWVMPFIPLVVCDFATPEPQPTAIHDRAGLGDRGSPTGETSQTGSTPR
jgi:hypothetical protein